MRENSVYQNPYSNVQINNPYTIEKNEYSKSFYKKLFLWWFCQHVTESTTQPVFSYFQYVLKYVALFIQWPFLVM